MFNSTYYKSYRWAKIKVQIRIKVKVVCSMPQAIGVMNKEKGNDSV